MLRMVLQLELLLFLGIIILISTPLNLSLVSDLELGADDDEFKRDDFLPHRTLFLVLPPLLIRWKVLQTKTGEPQASWTRLRMLNVCRPKSVENAPPQAELVRRSSKDVVVVSLTTSDVRCKWGTTEYSSQVNVGGRRWKSWVVEMGSSLNRPSRGRQKNLDDRLAKLNGIYSCRLLDAAKDHFRPQKKVVAIWYSSNPAIRLRIARAVKSSVGLAIEMLRPDAARRPQRWRVAAMLGDGTDADQKVVARLEDVVPRLHWAAATLTTSAEEGGPKVGWVMRLDLWPKSRWWPIAIWVFKLMPWVSREMCRPNSVWVLNRCWVAETNRGLFGLGLFHVTNYWIQILWGFVFEILEDRPNQTS